MAAKTNAPRAPLPRLKATIPHVLYQFCLSRGLSAERLEKDWGVAASAVSDPDAWVTYELGLALWDALIAHCSEEPVGVQFGATVGFIDLGLVGLAAAHAATVAEAFETFAPLQHLVDPCLQVQLTKESSGDVLCCASHPELLRRIHPMEAMLVSTNTALGRLTQHNVKPCRVEFAAEPQAQPEVYLEHFGVLPERTQRYALTYPPEVFQLPLAGSHPLVLKYLTQHGMSVPGPPVAQPGLAERIAQWLCAAADAEPPCPVMASRLADVAASFGASRRDLQRRLANEGTTFRDIQEGIARERARTLLRRPDVAITQVAYSLGYLQPRSFQRACLRWFKLGPSAYRAKFAR